MADFFDACFEGASSNNGDADRFARPDNRDLLHNAELERTRRNLSGAEALARKALEADPESEEVWVFFVGLAASYLEAGDWRRGVDLAEECHRANPRDAEYRDVLFAAYVEAATRQWTFIDHGAALPSGWYPTSVEQIEAAERCIDEARRLGTSNPEAQKEFDRQEALVNAMRGRVFFGSKFVAGFYIVVGVLCLGENPALGLVLLTIGALYAISCRIPRHKLNSLILSGKGGVTSGDILGQAASKFGEGRHNSFGVLLWTLAGTLAAAPFLTISNFIRNYATS